ncbi:MAG: DUF885 domain-containing protein [SAR86 cluster bacterium]|jgi:prolyl oligopeptidase|nr:DUF885 domain-containing protein [SAR86 cluster bacterium]
MKNLLQSLLLFFIFISFTASSSIDENEKFLSFLEQEWQWELAQNPVYATKMGVKGFETQWRDDSLKGIKLREAHIQNSFVELKKFDLNSLNKTNQLNLRLYTQLTQTALNISKYNRYLFPFNHRGGVQLAHEAVESLPLNTAEDYRFWIERLKNLDKRIEQTISIARLGLEKNYKAPKVLMERVYRQIKIQSKQNIENNPFYQVFKELPSTIPLEEQKALRKDARKTIKEEIIPSYELLEEFFKTEYLPQARLTVGLYDTPKGKELYEQLAKSFTTTNLTPKEIHNIGLDEVARIRGEMEEVIKEVKFEGTFKEFLVFLREDKRFYYDTAEELFEGYLAVSKRIDPELVALFGKLPRTPYGLRPIPMESAPDTTTAYYMPPAPNGLRPGYYYVNLYKPETRPKFEMEVLSVHEAVPGHHLQISLAMEKEDMPMFRRVSPYTAFVEGWGLYSESLGYELGLYTDPYSKFGQLTYDMWRAVRLVVDTGMHYFEWERQQAIDFFLENAAKSELDIVNEIDRYIVMPGQALAYKIGQMKFAALKEKTKKDLGVNFDVRKFHDLVLSEGAIPLNELDTLVENYIRLESEKD